MFNIKDLDIDEVSSILENKDFDEFINCAENEIFDAKSDLNDDFSNPNVRYHLAKDITSFANSNGGFIIYGLTTDQSPVEPREYVTEIKHIKKDKFNRGAINSIAKHLIYPQIKDIKVEWIKREKDDDLGLGYIYIPPQDEKKKLFLIKRIFEDEIEVDKIVFGIAIRRGSSSQPLTIEKLYSSIKRGRRDEAIILDDLKETVNGLVGELSVVKNVIRQVSKTSFQEKDPNKRIADYIDRMIRKKHEK